MMASSYLLFGVVMVLMALANRWIYAWPVSPAIAYIAIGAPIGPAGFALFDVFFRLAELGWSFSLVYCSRTYVGRHHRLVLSGLCYWWCGRCQSR